mmetsp:Transcript_17210/g.23649  ORF Transcript_17210/g.23649 Transcript_17210/m.23649 type:complete len:192 (-) Transcript_17210:377-952(-)|eukprot:CAMPEP_0194569490 /NCGR_PEP_ID=MMETSP0292-20121207/7182_1 /TAXON_ID=39354 /ORGANISM="Heterosigma akashiwo, Strain CCMP2393" /LENGTH=191 /DNA_ID=CAMNT_0039419745 /DNA_START=118 /DNA_END=693 /DNA_ORIENTATION=+
MGAIDFDAWGFNESIAQPAFFMMVAVFAVPHVLYAYIWLGTNSYVKQCKDRNLDPAEVVANLGVWIKVWQYLSCVAWYIQNGPAFSIWNVTLPRLLAAIALIGAGQVFNFAVYKTLGKDGVYYGSKLGRPGPWVKGFPFVIRDPQYSGCVMTIWGGFFLFQTATHLQNGMLPLTLAWTACYAASSIIEGEF